MQPSRAQAGLPQGIPPDALDGLPPCPTVGRPPPSRERSRPNWTPTPATSLTAAQLAERHAIEAIDRDGYHPQLATELSMQHGGPQGAWDYAVRKALTQRPAAAPPRSQADQRAAIALTALRERGDTRGLAASLVREHGSSPDVWSRAVKAAREITDPTT